MADIKKKIALGVILISLMGCGTSKPQSKDSDKGIYRIGKAELKKNSGFIRVDGSIEANDSKKIFVDKKLKVKEVFIQEGDYVEKGAVLMTFDESERNSIKRNLEKEKLNLSKLKRNYAIEKELNRIGGSSDNSLKELYESIRTSEINIESLLEDLEKTTEKIISPVSGTVTTLTAQENYSVNTDEPLLELADLSDIKIVLEIPEYDVKDIQLGQHLTLRPEVFQKKESFPGNITKISRVSKVSKTTSENVLEVEVTPEKTIPHIVPGFKVSATIDVGDENMGIAIPSTSILKDEMGYYLFAVKEGGTAEKREIEFKELKGDKILILKGLDSGENYLINPDKNLKTGDKIGGEESDKNKKPQ
ncbi:MAG: efflux RND transporter periplasmic adaptor subunit [Fusobacteriaceae bacterium]